MEDAPKIAARLAFGKINRKYNRLIREMALRLRYMGSRCAYR